MRRGLAQALFSTSAFGDFGRKAETVRKDRLGRVEDNPEEFGKVRNAHEAARRLAPTER